MSCAHRLDVQFFPPLRRGVSLFVGRRYLARFGVFLLSTKCYSIKKAGTRNLMMTPVLASHLVFPVPAEVVIYCPPLLTIQQSTCSSSCDLGGHSAHLNVKVSVADLFDCIFSKSSSW